MSAHHAFFENLESRELLATFFVTNVNDSGAGSLRDAISQANAAGGADIIEIDVDSEYGPIALSGTPLTISDDLTINGPGADQLTVSGDNLSRVFYNTATTVISGMTITGGNAVGGSGGGIYNQYGSTLTLVNSTVSGNTASNSGGGINNDFESTLTLVNSTVSGNTASDFGGGIYNEGSATLTVTNSTVSGNTAGESGGGVVNQGTLTVSTSTVSGNSASSVGGGLFNGFGATLTVNNSELSGNNANWNGGGIYNAGLLTVAGSTVSGNTATLVGGGGIFNTATLSLTTSTVSGNSAERGGGIYSDGFATLTVTNSTVSGNSAVFGGGICSGALATLTVSNSTVLGNTASNTGGGVYNDGGTASISSTIVAGNTANGLPSDVVGTLTSGSTTNLIQDAGSSGGLIHAVNGNILGVDPLLGPLASNGGPTQTHALFAGSPAIGAGINPLSLTTDQRGGLYARGSAVDIGAYQRQSLALVVDTLSDVVDGNYGSGQLSLREAVAAAGPNPVASTVSFATALHGGTITLAGTELALMGDLTITGPGANLLTVSGNNLSRVFHNSGTFVISGLTITGGSADYEDGGGISNHGTLTLMNSTVSGNTGSSGGGILNYGTLTLMNSTVSGNSTGLFDYGGGIYNGGTLTVTNSTVSGNTASGSGGGIYSHGTLTVTDSTLSGNSASHGGGIYNIGAGALVVANSTISENSAHVGGGVCNYGSVTITRTTISANSSAAGAGGIYNYGTLTVASSTVSGNTSSGSGGGITNYNVSATLTVLNSTVSGNTSIGSGGGIYNYVSATLTVTNSTIFGNTASDSGGGIRNNAGTAAITSTVVAGNTANGLPSDVLGTLTSTSNNNLIEDAGSSGGLSNGVGGNLVGVDPLLGPLASNGGPTQTHALLGGSPAINAGADPNGLSTDQRGLARTRGLGIDIGAFEFTATPTIGSLGSSASFIQRGQSVTLTATTVSDADGTIAHVDFYRDANNNGIAETSEHVRRDTNAADGYAFTYTVPAGSILGATSFLAVAVDNDGEVSTLGIASVTITNATPTIASLTPSASSLGRGQTVTLTANSVTDSDGTIAHVDFYRDANNNGIAETSEHIRRDTNGADGYTFAYTVPAGLPLGTTSFFAVAMDNDGRESEDFAASVEITDAISIGSPIGAASAGNTHRVVSVNTLGHVIVFQQGWIFENLQEKTGAPDATSPAVLWTDPKDGLTYVAATSASGLILFTRSSTGTWSFRNLTTETGATSSPAGSLTQFTSIRQRIVIVAGITEDGRIVAFKQSLTTAPGGGPDFDFVDISADLTAQGQTTPQLTSMISYVPSWDTWNLAGIDNLGRIQSVWINPRKFTRWRTDNLSAITNAPAISGQLAVTLTTWGGINLTGLNSAGNLLTTWWVPRFGGQWAVSDLTTRYGGPQLVGGNLTAYTTPWGGINYVGLDSGGTVRVYWWIPRFKGQWAISPLLPSGTPSASIPTGALTSSSSAAGTLNVYGTNSSGNVLRMAWQPGAGSVWNIEDLTTIAVEQ